VSWYRKYLSVYQKPFAEVPVEAIAEVREKLKKQQSEAPLVSVVLIAHNEEKRLLSCLWSLSENQCKYPMEIIGVDNDSTDRTSDVYTALELPHYSEPNRGLGYARRCGLQHAKGKYLVCIDSDTMYPAKYVEIMVDELEKPGVVGVSSLHGYFPDAEHSWLGLKIYEFIRDIHLLIQSINRPEMSVRSMVFAHNTEYARKVGYRVDIIRGEDGTMALGLKNYGKLVFIRNRRARAVTGYGTLNADGSFFNAFKARAVKYLKRARNYFSEKKEYKDEKSNLIK